MQTSFTSKRSVCAAVLLAALFAAALFLTRRRRRRRRLASRKYDVLTPPYSANGASKEGVSAMHAYPDRYPGSGSTQATPSLGAKAGTTATASWGAASGHSHSRADSASPYASAPVATGGAPRTASTGGASSGHAAGGHRGSVQTGSDYESASSRTAEFWGSVPSAFPPPGTTHSGSTAARGGWVGGGSGQHARLEGVGTTSGSTGRGSSMSPGGWQANALPSELTTPGAVLAAEQIGTNSLSASPPRAAACLPWITMCLG